MFIKVRNIQTGYYYGQTIINTDQIAQIQKHGDKYDIYFQGTTVTVFESDAQRLFQAIGVSL